MKHHAGAPVISDILNRSECEVARTDKSYSEHVLCRYLTPSPTKWALNLSLAVRIRLYTEHDTYSLPDTGGEQHHPQVIRIYI